MEVWAEKSKLLGNMDLPTALGAFSTSVFVLILNTQRCDIIKFSYVCKHNVLQGGEFVADWLQRAVCKYGDQTGLI